MTSISSNPVKLHQRLCRKEEDSGEPIWNPDRRGAVEYCPKPGGGNDFVRLPVDGAIAALRGRNRREYRSRHRIFV